MQIWVKQTSDEKVPLPHVVLGSVLGPVIARATAKTASERYPSAAAMRDDLEKLLIAASAATDPLAKPIVPDVTRITARMPRDQTPAAAPLPQGTVALPPLAPRATLAPSTPPPATAPSSHAPSQPSSYPQSRSPTSSSRQPASTTGAAGTGAVIVILGVVAFVAMLLAAGAGVALYMMRRGAAVDAPPLGAAAERARGPTGTCVLAQAVTQLSRWT